MSPPRDCQLLGKLKLGRCSWAVSLCSVSWEVLIVEEILVEFLDTKNAHIKSQSKQHGIGQGGINDVVYVVIEVDWHFNSCKLALEQKHVALSRETKVSLKIWCMLYSTVGIFFTIVVLDSPNNYTIQHIWNIMSFFVLNNG